EIATTEVGINAADAMPAIVCASIIEPASRAAAISTIATAIVAAVARYTRRGPKRWAIRAPSMMNAATTRKCSTIAVFTELADVPRPSASASTDTLSVVRLKTRSRCASVTTISGIHETRFSAAAAGVGTDRATGSLAARSVVLRVTRQRTGREEGEQREAGQREERDLERHEPRLRVDPHRFAGLLVGRGGRRERVEQAIVADERHLVQIELGLQLVRDQRIMDEVTVHAGA